MNQQKYFMSATMDTSSRSYSIWRSLARRKNSYNGKGLIFSMYTLAAILIALQTVQAMPKSKDSLPSIHPQGSKVEDSFLPTTSNNRNTLHTISKDEGNKSNVSHINLAQVEESYNLVDLDDINIVELKRNIIDNDKSSYSNKRKKRRATNPRNQRDRGSRYHLVKSGKSLSDVNTTDTYYLGTPEFRKPLDPFINVVYASNYNKGFLVRGREDSIRPGVGDSSDFQAHMKQFSRPTPPPYDGHKSNTSNANTPVGITHGTPDSSIWTPSPINEVKTTPQVYVPDDISHNPVPYVITSDSGRGQQRIPGRPEIPDDISVPHPTTDSTPGNELSSLRQGVGHVGSGDGSGSSYRIWKLEKSTPTDNEVIEPDATTPKHHQTTFPTYPRTNTLATPLGDRDGLVYEGPGQGSIDKIWVGRGRDETTTLSRYSYTPYPSESQQTNIPGQDYPSIHYIGSNGATKTNPTAPTSTLTPDFLFGSTPVHTSYKSSTFNTFTDDVSPLTHEYPDTLNGDSHTAIPRLSTNYSQPPHQELPSSESPIYGIYTDTEYRDYTLTPLLFTEGTQSPNLDSGTPRNGKSYALIDEVGQDRGISIIRFNQSIPDGSLGPDIEDSSVVIGSVGFTGSIHHAFTTPNDIEGPRGIFDTVGVFGSRTLSPGFRPDEGITDVPSPKSSPGNPISTASLSPSAVHRFDSTTGYGRRGKDDLAPTSPRVDLVTGPSLIPFLSDFTGTSGPGVRGDIFRTGDLTPRTTSPGSREPLIDQDRTPYLPSTTNDGNIISASSTLNNERVTVRPGIPGIPDSSSSVSAVTYPEDVTPHEEMFSSHFLREFTSFDSTPRSDSHIVAPPFSFFGGDVTPLSRRLPLLDPFRRPIKGGGTSGISSNRTRLIGDQREQVPPSVYGMDMDAWQCEFDTMALNEKRAVDFICPEDRIDGDLFPIADKQCLWYVMCSNQDPWYMCCPAGTLFDSVHRKCEHTDKIDCVRGLGYPKAEK